MEKRFVLAVFLMILILIVFQYFSSSPPTEKISLEESDGGKIENLLSEVVYEPASSEGGTTIALPLYTLLISENGGIRSYILEEYKTRNTGVSQVEQQLKKAEQQFRQQGIDPNSSLLYSINKLRYHLSHLKRSGGNEGVELVSFGELYHNSLFPFVELRNKDNKLIWAEKGKYKFVKTESNRIQLIQEIPDFGTIKKEFIFNPDSYLIDVKIILENTGSGVSEPYDLILTCGPDIGIDESIKGFTNLVPLALVNDQIKKEQFGRDSKNKTIEKTEYGEVGWVALQDKYFAKIIIPREKVGGAYINKNEYEEYKVGLKTEIPYIQPLESREFSFGVYAGPKKLEDLNRVGKDTAKIIDYGVFGNFFHIVHILKFFYRLTNNYGVAIIFLTVLISLILLPLSLKSFKSMKEMHKLQPEMERIKKEFKDDPQRMNKEVMELYKRHKVNPVGGCLPMFLQMPIFIGLFMTLRSVIELRGAPFMLWIKDLSIPDALTLPFNLPFQLGTSINILPLVMTGVTFLQQKVSGSGGTSKMFVLLLPLMMLFIFYNFPAGLVLYFLCSNVINILEQLWINHSGAKKV